MSSLTSKYSNWQIYGFFGLFLTSSIWTYYALIFVKIIPYEKDVIDYLYDIIPSFGVYVGIPLIVSLLILHRMNTRKMVTKSNYYYLLLAGFTISAIVVAADYFILR